MLIVGSVPSAQLRIKRECLCEVAGEGQLFEEYEAAVETSGSVEAVLDIAALLINVDSLLIL